MNYVLSIFFFFFLEPLKVSIFGPFFFFFFFFHINRDVNKTAGEGGDLAGWILFSTPIRNIFSTLLFRRGFICPIHLPTFFSWLPQAYKHPFFFSSFFFILVCYFNRRVAEILLFVFISY